MFNHLKHLLKKVYVHFSIGYGVSQEIKGNLKLIVDKITHIFRRRHFKMRFKAGIEVSGTLKTAFQCNINHFFIWLFHKLGSGFKSVKG